MMIFSADTDNKVSWTKYSDDLCTTKLIPEGDDTNEVDIVYDGTTCNNVLDQMFKMTKKNGKGPGEQTCSTDVEKPVIGSCTLFDDNLCATPSTVDGGDQTFATKNSIGAEATAYY